MIPDGPRLGQDPPPPRRRGARHRRGLERRARRAATSRSTTLLVQGGSISEDALLETLGRAAGIAADRPLARRRPIRTAVEALPQETVHRARRPADREERRRPDDRHRRPVRRAPARRPEAPLRAARCAPVLAHPARSARARDASPDRRAGRSRRSSARSTSERRARGQGRASDDIDDGRRGSGEDAPAVKLINLILLRALKEKASDIHIEPGEKQRARALPRRRRAATRSCTPPKAI